MFGRSKRELARIERDVKEIDRRIEEKLAAAVTAGHRTVEAINAETQRKLRRRR